LKGKNKMDNVMDSNVYILNYQKGEEQSGPFIYWNEDAAIIDFFDMWINTKKGLSVEMIREAWNSLMNTATIPEVGEVVSAKFADYVRGEEQR
jgi:hypothetical protein